MSLIDLLQKSAEDLGGIFSPQELTVAAYRRDPMRMALAGYPEYPDHHRTTSALYGRRGMIAQGYFERVDGGLRLTEPSSQPGQREERANGKTVAHASQMASQSGLRGASQPSLQPTAAEREIFAAKPYAAMLLYMNRTKLGPQTAKLAFESCNNGR